jgi:DNA polymerase-3 subunit delta
MTLLAGLIDQLSLYANGVITVQHVDDLVPEARERTVFELANAVAPGKREASYRVIAKLFEQRGSAIGMAAIMARHYRQLMQTKWHLDEGGRTEELSKILGVPPFAVAGLVEQARAHTDKAIYKAVSLLAEADRDLKGPARTALGERIIIERLADRLIDLLPQKEKVEW